jgi:hypothetical protein
MSRNISFAVALWVASGGITGHAREPLLVKNINDAPVIMEYVPQNGESVYTVRFKPNQEKPVELQDDDPFFVNHRLDNERTVEWKVWEATDVYLNKLAELKETYELQLTFHEDNDGRKVQVMSATLVNPQSGDEVTLFDQPGNESDFVSNIINRSWSTVRNAPDGQTDNVRLDFENLAFRSNRFEGRLQQMLVGENDSKCIIRGRWFLREERQGEVYFEVDKQNPDVITGYCTLKGEQPRKKYPWNSR